MYKRSFFQRTAVMLLAVTMLSACGKQAESRTETQSQSQTSTGAAADFKEKPQADSEAVYTTMELTAEGISLEPGTAYYLPLGEGKYVPAEEEAWKDYLGGEEFEILENFSMPFIAVDQGDKALVYVLENPYRTKVRFTCNPNLRMELVGATSSLDKDSDNKVRVYTTKNNAVHVAKAYKSFLAETGEILTLEQKAKKNPNIEKLYGAPHIYLWGEYLLSREDVNWQAFLQEVDNPLLSHVSKILIGTVEEGQFAEVLGKAAGQDYLDNYQKGILLYGLSLALTQEDFYDAALFPKSNQVMKNLLALEQLDRVQFIELNKQALYENLEGVFQPVEGWYDYESVDILEEMKSAGVENAWIGLNSWEQAYNKPILGETAIRNGYLFGPYDSYHSIHEPGKEQWNTAKFPDISLYENATVMKQDGEKAQGFQKTGRKLNPTLSMPAVMERVQGILDTGLQFNSWFVDCDATGEALDDYSPEHPTTKQQDTQARLERMDYIAGQHNMVVGSEGGNDFAANSIAFAHGIELPTFSWMDEDMKANKDSEYYLGRYYAAEGGVPEKFAKTVPVKEEYRTLFLDMSYQIPLYKLVYNNSVITTYHWDWSTFKIQGESENRMVREVLYNVPPLYHLDRAQWDQYQEKIITHNTVWSVFSKKAIALEMTEFDYLTEDRQVQMTKYGENLWAVGNFSGNPFPYEGEVIPPSSVLIIDGGVKTVYTP